MINLFVFYLLSFCVASFANAHPLDLGVLNISGNGNNPHARLELNPQVGARLLKVDLTKLSPEYLDTHRDELMNQTLGTGRLSIGASECTWNSNAHVKIENPQLLALDVDANCPKKDGDVSLNIPFLKTFDSSYRLLAMVKLNGVEHVAGADPLHTDLKFSFSEKSYGFSDFVSMGLEHIGVAPEEWSDDTGFHLPKGMDHILFVIALLLTGGTLLGFLKTITGFTLGHTTSLALVTFGVVQVSGRWIEAAIALTIAIVAAQGVIGRDLKHKMSMTIGIGLIHGLGFAAALSGLNLNRTKLISAVLGFNVGVELGQATIVLFFVPFLIYLSRHSSFQKYIVKSGAALIFIASSFWFVKRAFL